MFELQISTLFRFRVQEFANKKIRHLLAQPPWITKKFKIVTKSAADAASSGSLRKQPTWFRQCNSMFLWIPIGRKKLNNVNSADSVGNRQTSSKPIKHQTKWHIWYMVLDIGSRRTLLDRSCGPKTVVFKLNKWLKILRLRDLQWTVQCRLEYLYILCPATAIKGNHTQSSGRTYTNSNRKSRKVHSNKKKNGVQEWANRSVGCQRSVPNDVKLPGCDQAGC